MFVIQKCFFKITFPHRDVLEKKFFLVVVARLFFCVLRKPALRSWQHFVKIYFVNSSFHAQNKHARAAKGWRRKFHVELRLKFGGCCRWFIFCVVFARHRHKRVWIKMCWKMCHTSNTAKSARRMKLINNKTFSCFFKILRFFRGKKFFFNNCRGKAWNGWVENDVTVNVNWVNLHENFKNYNGTF